MVTTIRAGWYWTAVVVAIAIGTYAWIRQPSVLSEPKANQLDFLTISGDLAATREAIAKNMLSKKGSKGAGTRAPIVWTRSPDSKIDSISVQEDGLILVTAHDFGEAKKSVVLVLIPRLSDLNTTVTWDCIGYPREVMPSNCR